MAKHSAQQIAKAVALHKKGMTYEKIAKSLRLGSWQIAWHLVNTNGAKATRKAKAAKRSTRRAA